MATLTIRNLDESVKLELRKRAADNGRSLEAEVRATLGASVLVPPKPRTGEELWQRIRDVVEPVGGIHLDIPPRRPVKLPGSE